MIPSYRQWFNKEFSSEKYQNMITYLNEGRRKIEFRIAETPIFIDKAFKEKIIQAGKEIIDVIKHPDFKHKTDAAIPRDWHIPNENKQCHFLTFDFGVCREPSSGELVPKLIEMQGFPSLYGYQVLNGRAFEKFYDIPKKFSIYLSDYDEEKYIKKFRKVLLGNCSPNEVILMDIKPMEQKTRIDFELTEELTGVTSVCYTDLKTSGKTVYYINAHGKKVEVKRIYNRLIFDEIENHPEIYTKAIDIHNDLDVEFITHPHWFYRISKYTLPFINSQFVPKTYFLHTIKSIPVDLENYVLKPLFSFAGMGVVIDVTKKDIESIKNPENWILQEKVTYAPVIQSPTGGVKTEIRMMYLWEDGCEPELVVNLSRLSRGKMIGVRYNTDFDWVGGTVCFFER